MVRRASNPYPERLRQGYYRVVGPTAAGRHVEVIYVRRLLEEIVYPLLTLPMLASVWDGDAEFYGIFHALPR